MEEHNATAQNAGSPNHPCRPEKHAPSPLLCDFLRSNVRILEATTSAAEGPPALPPPFPLAFGGANVYDAFAVLGGGPEDEVKKTASGVRFILRAG